MAKKRLSRLEFYGYRDQNHYTTFYDCGSGTNQRQDEAIEKILDVIEGIDDDVEAISGAVATITDELDGIGADIAGLSAVTAENKSDIANVNTNMRVLSGIVGGHTSVLVQHGNRLDVLEETVSGNTESIAEMNEKLTEILGKDYATMSDVDAIYAKKDDVYTKQECDDKFLTEHQSLSGYVTHDEFEEAIAEIESGSSAAVSALTERVDALEEYDAEQDAQISGLGETFETELSRINEALAGINTKDAEQDAAIAERALQSDLTTLSGVVDTMATQEGLEALQERLDQVSYAVETKASKDELQQLQNAMNDADSLLDGRLGRAEETLGAVVNTDLPAILQYIADLEEADRNIDLRISGNTVDIERERNERINSDKALSGKATDSSSDITIYGTRKYAEEVANERAIAKADAALREAKEYADGKDAELHLTIGDEIQAVKDDFESKLILKADTTAVTASINSLRDNMAVAIGDAEARSKSYTDTRYDALREDCYGYTDERYNALDVIVTDLSTRLADLERKHDALCEEINCKFNTLLQQLVGYDINIDLTGCDNDQQMH